MKDAIEAKIANTYAASASDLLFTDRHASSDENSAAKRVNDLSTDLKQVHKSPPDGAIILLFLKHLIDFK